ncbi:NlpC/P60 family protein [Lactobacillus paragasseri]|uniref:SLT domain protein n=2 Tax=Lactobacillus TaxID=1578 RepID=A0ABQ0N160_9LACO|nr:NlpC/P60 family protein [Lactobacillus paragasseri]MBT1276984.1 SLT domain protein [Lactobacillus paragasseri]WRS91616.1 NlpC/P60 family protein [Lactobacillus paragasseri]GBA80363.1 SLT domain protein [Lactobacillus paragasseri]
MAGKIPVGDFNTRISLDGEQPIQTLKSLKNEVSSATSAWKAQVTELKTAGDQLGAAKAKYEGLGDTLKKQQSLLERNKSELNSLKEAQSKVDKSTEKGRNEYERYSKEIATAERNVANATTRIAKLSQQQDRARNSLDYYKSGLASAQSALRKISESSNAYVGRLEAEGKHEEANKAKLSGLSREYDKLNEVYKIQSNELAKIASEAGKSSEAYRRQKVRVDETATSLAKTKSEMSGLSSEMKKTNPSIFDKIKAKIFGVKSEAKETHSVFGQVFGANILSNVAQSAWGHLTSVISSAKDEAKQYSLEQETMLATWHTLTGSAKEGQKLVDMTTKMAIAANNSVSMVDALNQKFYAINKNADVTGKLTKSVLTLQDAFGATDDAVENFGVQFSQMMANGKVSAQDMMSFVNVFPVLRTNLLKAEQSITHNSKMTMSQMNDLMSAGKITSKTMEKVLEDTAKQYQGATENFGKTIPGMMRTVKSQMPVLLSAISDPLTKAANPIVARISDWITSKNTKNAFTKLGKTFSDGLNKTLNSMSKGTGKNAGKDITDTLNRGLEKLNGLVKDTFNFLSAHGKDIASIVVDVGKLSGAIGKQVWKDFADIISTIGGAFGLVSDKASKSNDPLAKIADIVHNLAKNKTAIKLIAGYLVTMATIKTLSPLATGLMGIAKGGKAAYKFIKGMPDAFETMQIKGLLAVDKLKSGFGKLGSVIKDLYSNTGNGKFAGALQSIHSAGGFGGLSTAGKVATGVAGVGVALDAGSSILSAFKDKKGSMKQYQDAGKGIGSAIGGGIGLFFGGPAGAAIGSQIGKVAGGWGGKATKEFLNGWKSKKPPKNFWSLENLGWSTKDAFGKMSKGIDSWWKGIKKSNQKSQKEWQKIDKLREQNQKKQQKAWNDYWKKVGKGFEKFGKDSKKNLDKTVKNSQDFIKKLGPNIKKGYDNFLKNGHNFFKKFYKNFGDTFKKLSKNKYVKAFQKGKLFQTAYKDIQKKTKKWTKDFGKSWNNHWKNTQKAVSKWSKNTKKNYDKGTKSLQKSFKSWSKNAKKTWDSHWNNLHKSVGDFWTNSKKIASEGTKKLLGQDKEYRDKSGKEWLKHHSYVTDISNDFQKNLKKNHGNMLDALKQTTGDQLHKIAHNFADKWDSIKRDTAKKWSDMKSNASKWGSNMHSWFDGFNRKWRTGWSNLGKGIQNIFSNIWKSMQKLGKNAMNGLIDIVNGGIGAVNDVIYFFGGGHSTVKKLSHFATGTGYFGSQRRAITEPTLAMVNDGNDSPETGNKEALYRPMTGEFGIFQGRNTTTMLMPGDEILNASDTKNLMNAMGVAHFANGGIGGFFSNIGKNVGNFFGGIGSWAKNTMDGMKKFFDLAKKIVSGPQKYLDGIFKWTGVKGLSRGAFHTMITKGFDKGKKQVSAFWKTLWNMVSSSLDGEAEGGLLGAVEKYGKGKPYVWGAEGPDAFDCSGLVKYALEKAFGKSFPHYSGDQYAMSRGVKDPQIGDLVFFGPGGRNHVGVYAGNGKVWSARSPRSGIGMDNVSDFHEGAVSYRRIPGLKNEGGEGNVKANSNLEKFIKRLPGMGGFFKFISKIGDLFGIAADAKDPAGTGADRWGEDIKKAAETMHTSVTPTDIRKIISMIAGESGGNPKAVQPGADPDGDGSGPARGLLQYKTSTFNAYKVKGHGNIYHGWDQLLALFNDSNWRNDIHFGAGWGPTGHARYANGGIANQPSIFGEAGPEMAIPLSAVKSSRSYELLGKTAAIVAARDNLQPTTVNTGSLGEKLDKVIDLLTAILTSPSTVETSINVDKQALGNSITEVVNARMRLNSINREKGISVIR